MKIGPYDHLPYKDQLAFIRLLIFCEGLASLRRFDMLVAEILGSNEH